jgi:bacterioferritin-associated ferredoxin
MYVCYCRSVTDHEVRDAIDRGARSIPQLAENCGAGARCRGCWPALHELIAEGSERPLAASSS